MLADAQVLPISPNSVDVKMHPLTVDHCAAQSVQIRKKVITADRIAHASGSFCKCVTGYHSFQKVNAQGETNDVTLKAFVDDSHNAGQIINQLAIVDETSCL